MEKRKLVNDDDLRSTKVPYNNSKFITVLQASVKSGELTSFAFIMDHSHQL